MVLTWFRIEGCTLSRKSGAGLATPLCPFLLWKPKEADSTSEQWLWKQVPAMPDLCHLPALPSGFWTSVTYTGSLPQPPGHCSGCNRPQNISSHLTWCTWGRCVCQFVKHRREKVRNSRRVKNTFCEILLGNTWICLHFISLFAGLLFLLFSFIFSFFCCPLSFQQIWDMSGWFHYFTSQVFITSVTVSF